METIDNIKLIDNGLRHIECEFTFESPSLFRVLRESHSIFYRSMVEALRGTDNSFITGRNGDKNKKLIIKIGDEDWKQIIKGPVVEGCKKAWRYTEPGICSKPEKLGEPLSDAEWQKSQAWLIPFYDAVAMVQAKPFMCRFTCSNELSISNSEMILLEWAHEKIRNVYEHFVPKLYSSSRKDLERGLLLLLEKSDYLLFVSGNISYRDHEILNQMRNKIHRLRSQALG
ncbi:hypothetical protein MNBD_GAMMA08-2506 [hydrothermal vent metagenome]|uniref:Uncharacterized protein n=1 Tax=hydrothermal vent metagenome TaxID=652676 RepID=A0A3B0X9Z9_9ZZZZ